MTIVVTGATGNIGTSVTQALVRAGHRNVVALARHLPKEPDRSVTWAAADLARDDLAVAFADADAVIHLAWKFNPTRQPLETWHDNVVGTARTLAAAVAAGVGTVVVSSSIGAYAPRPSDEPVTERWATLAHPGAAYGLQKAYVERMLDAFELRHPDIRLVRIRPAFVFKQEASPEQRRIFAGPFVPGRLLKPGRLPVVPVPRGFRMQCVHADDLAQAFVTSVDTPVSGAFNIATEPVVRRDLIGEVLGTRTVEVSQRVVRAALASAFHLRLTPAEPGLFDLFTSLPVMDTTRARVELGWAPRHDAASTLRELVSGLVDPVGAPTPKLDVHAGGPLRIKEFLSGMGSRE